MNNNIIIQCWSGKILFEGNYKDKLVDKVLDANRCHYCDRGVPKEYVISVCVADHICKNCNGTGYSGDFSAYWQDQTRKDNVYEYINY